MLVSSALSSQRSDVGLKNEAGLEHLPRKETMQCSEHRQRTGIKRRRTRRDEGPSAVAALENTHCGEKTNASTKAGTADFELAGQLTLRGEPVAEMNLTAADERANVLDDLHGELAMAGGLVV